MNYKILLASLLPISVFAMETETKKHEVKIAQIAPTQEQRDWLRKLNSAILEHTAVIKGACLNQIKELIVKLKAQDALNYYSQEEDNEFPLYYACLFGNKEVVKLLIDAGTDINLHMPLMLTTPLHTASRNISSNGEFLVELLINKGADVNAQDAYLEIPLHRASCGKMVTLLLQAGSPLEALGTPGETPLLNVVKMARYATGHQHSVEAIYTLLSYGANIYAQDKNGETAYQLLKNQGFDPEQLIKQGQEKRDKRQKLYNDWFKFAHQLNLNIQNNVINISNTQINIYSAIASARCPTLKYLMLN